MTAPSLTERYWSKVDTSDADGCWPWTGSTSGQRRGPAADYGQLTVRGRTLLAHRVGWELANGPIPEGMCVCHTCDVGICQQPAHHFLGTHQENMADSSRKGRRHSSRNAGAANPRAKLTAAQASEVRALAAAGHRQRDIGARFGISQGAVSEIASGKKWAAL